MTSSSNLLQGLILMLVISGVLVLGNMGVKHYDSDSTFGEGNVLLDSFGDRNNGTLYEVTGDMLPESEDSVSAESGNIFTDLFKTAKNWILERTGARYIIDIIQAPMVLLKSFGLDPLIVWVIGAIWYGVFFFLVISWLFNR